MADERITAIVDEWEREWDGLDVVGDRRFAELLAESAVDTIGRLGDNHQPMTSAEMARKMRLYIWGDVTRDI